ncbi:hypothetical protein C2845_PM08G17040 [Panicum miliaceum]|uniref:F-box domain-containing protein n=1 Tax=Panicum miliaceum TaxID=4540 RepID=A0A3L6QXY4_PANMI|nr:hypothetical protein C2845_PM08G17040 [Panicum miliaceum]
MELLPPGADRLIALPDDVLVLILEKLGGAREAIRACSLVSRRWSQLPWLLQEPKISVGDFTPRGTELYELDAAELGRAMGAFCRAVSSFLSNAPEATATATARCLSLEFFLAKGCLPTVQRLLGGGEEGQRACSSPSGRRPGVAAVLGACRRLERLALRHCHRTSGGGGEALVINAPPGSALRELVLDMCFYTLAVLRSAPRLTRLTCGMWAAGGAPLSLTGVPCLEMLVLANGASQLSWPFMLSKLLADATNLRRSPLNFESEENR